MALDLFFVVSCFVVFWLFFMFFGFLWIFLRFLGVFLGVLFGVSWGFPRVSLDVSCSFVEIPEATVN